jgi:uncharacterized membrane protein YdjX (TVP38/TMEM64 family)
VRPALAAHRLAPVAGVLIPLLVLAASFGAVASVGGPGEMRERLGAAGLAGAIVLHALLNLTPVGELVPISVANGAVFGVVLGAAVNWTGWMTVALVQYAAARRVGGAASEAAWRARLPRCLRGLPVEHLAFQVLTRSIPWVGMHGTNLASGWLRVPLPRFLLGGALGLLGPALTMAALGAGLLHLF